LTLRYVPASEMERNRALVPRCGTNDEVLRAHGLDADSVAGRVRVMARTAA
jgi:hypothetical protein